MILLVVGAVAFAASALTFVSGFGLGTLLMPVLAWFMPLERAVAATGVVHFLNSLFKFGLVGRRAHWPTVWRFGIPALLASLLGAWWLLASRRAAAAVLLDARHARAARDDREAVDQRAAAGVRARGMGAAVEVAAFPARTCRSAACSAGLAGGISGMQGALRSAFLARAGLPRDAFVATGVAIACLIDVSRLGVYSRMFAAHRDAIDGPLLLVASRCCACAGALVGRRYLERLTMERGAARDRGAASGDGGRDRDGRVVGLRSQRVRTQGSESGAGHRQQFRKGFRARPTGRCQVADSGRTVVVLQNGVRSRLMLVVVAVALGVLPVGAQTRGLVPADFYKEVTVEEVAMRPQGDMVAFTVMTVVEKENRRHREIWLQPITNGGAQGEAFRFTAPTEESSQPRWSPDGALLAFTSKRDKDDNTAWFARVGGHGGEAFHIEGVAGRTGVVARWQVDRLREGADARRDGGWRRRQEGRARGVGGARCASRGRSMPSASTGVS